MSQQLIINVTSPAIMSSLKKILNAIDGVTIVGSSRTRKKTATEVINSDTNVIESIRRGEEDLRNGRTHELTSADIRNILGV